MGRADFDERQRRVKREAGRCGFVAILLAHCEDRSRAVLIMVYYGFAGRGSKGSFEEKSMSDCAKNILSFYSALDALD